jgi:hypothetical protein
MWCSIPKYGDVDMTKKNRIWVVLGRNGKVVFSCNGRPIAQRLKADAIIEAEAMPGWTIKKVEF